LWGILSHWGYGRSRREKARFMLSAALECREKLRRQGADPNGFCCRYWDEMIDECNRVLVAEFEQTDFGKAWKEEFRREFCSSPNGVEPH